jgi:type II secretion system protein C
MQKITWWLLALTVTGGLYCFYSSYCHRIPQVEKSPQKAVVEVDHNLPEESCNTQPQKLNNETSKQLVTDNKTPLQPVSEAEKIAAPLSAVASDADLSKPESPAEEPLDKVFFGCLKLKGTVVSYHDSQHNKAIIEDWLIGNQKSYRLGSVIPYGAKIVEIDHQGITLEKEGIRKKLMLSEMLGNEADIEELKAKGYDRIAEKEWLVTPNGLIKNTGDIFKLLGEASINLDFNSGKIEGFQLSKVKTGGLIRELGLNEGDLIRTINGETIDSVSKAYNLYQRIRQEPVIKIGLTRHKQKLDQAYHIISDGPPKYNMNQALKSADLAELFKLVMKK